MVYKAAMHIAENRSEGDLLMDAPRYEWQELCALAQNRDGWRARVNTLRHGTGVTIVMNDTLPGCHKHKHNTRSKADPTPASTPPLSPSKIAARRYRLRDAHEMFFRPGEGGKRKCWPGKGGKRKRHKNPLDN